MNKIENKSYLNKLAVIFTACLFLSLSVNAEEPKNTKNESAQINDNLKNIRGFVIDEFGEPIAGVIVVAQDSKNSAITNTEGKYTIKALETDILKFSQIGMTDKEEKITSSRIVNVELSMN